MKSKSRFKAGAVCAKDAGAIKFEILASLSDLSLAQQLFHHWGYKAASRRAQGSEPQTSNFESISLCGTSTIRL